MMTNKLAQFNFVVLAYTKIKMPVQQLLTAIFLYTKKNSKIPNTDTHQKTPNHINVMYPYLFVYMIHGITTIMCLSSNIFLALHR